MTSKKNKANQERWHKKNLRNSSRIWLTKQKSRRHKTSWIHNSAYASQIETGIQVKMKWWTALAICFF